MTLCTLKANSVKYLACGDHQRADIKGLEGFSLAGRQYNSVGQLSASSVDEIFLTRK